MMYLNQVWTNGMYKGSRMNFDGFCFLITRNRVDTYLNPHFPEISHTEILSLSWKHAVFAESSAFKSIV